MKFLRNIVITAALMLTPLAALADTPGRHPAYQRALSDLTTARADLQRPARSAYTQWDEGVATREIDAAIGAIQNASYGDGRAAYQYPQVDYNVDWHGRLFQSLDLLRRARADVAREEDNYYTQGLRNTALMHIDSAIAYVQQGIAANPYRR